MIRVSDYIAEILYDKGVRNVFMVTGGGAMHLNDSFARKAPFHVTYHHHEQACAIAAEGIYRGSGKVAVVNVTTGPGGLNALTGVMGQWTDSAPAIYISGQVKRATTISECPDLQLRQLGDQEVDIVSIVKPLVKYAVFLDNVKKVRYEIEKALFLALDGRKGPVWIDIPVDVQGAMIDPEDQQSFRVAQTKKLTEGNVPSVIKLLKKSQRPLIVAGHGIRLAGQKELFLSIANTLQIPIVTTFNGFDLVPSDNPQFCGRIGTVGTRAGNFCLQNADTVLFLGTRNNIRQTSYNWHNFAEKAKKIVVDIDRAELQKPTVEPDLAIHADLSDWLPSLKSKILKTNLPEWTKWLGWAKACFNALPTVPITKKTSSGRMNPYLFFRGFSQGLPDDAVLVAGNGTACVVLFQAGEVKSRQRVFWNSGCASMGYDLPAAIGAAIGTRSTVWCVAGDGSLQMNLQELATVAHNRLPIKIVYLENGGYASIRQTQSNFFKSEYGCSKNSGLGFPDMKTIAKAYKIGYLKTTKIRDLRKHQTIVATAPGPIVWEVSLDLDYTFEPKVSSRRLKNGQIVSMPIQDMYPFLPRREYKKYMLENALK